MRTYLVAPAIRYRRRKRRWFFGFPWRKRYPQNAGPGCCTFCSEDSRYVEKMYSGPGELRICSACLVVAQAVMADPPAPREAPLGLSCSFCSKPGEFGRLVAGPTAYICSECVARFAES